MNQNSIAKTDFSTQKEEKKQNKKQKKGSWNPYSSAEQHVYIGTILQMWTAEVYSILLNCKRTHLTSRWLYYT